MAVKLFFQEEQKTELNPILEVFVDDKNKLVVRVGYFNDDFNSLRTIKLNKYTSIKLAKEIRKQISLMED